MIPRLLLHKFPLASSRIHWVSERFQSNWRWSRHSLTYLQQFSIRYLLTYGGGCYSNKPHDSFNKKQQSSLLVCHTLSIYSNSHLQQLSLNWLLTFEGGDFQTRYWWRYLFVTHLWFISFTSCLTASKTLDQLDQVRLLWHSDVFHHIYQDFWKCWNLTKVYFLFTIGHVTHVPLELCLNSTHLPRQQTKLRSMHFSKWGSWE
jgi:hypothetical protein